MERTSWETYFMHLAEESAYRSKDPKTQVGACIVKDRRVLSLGYNGAPRNFPDFIVPKDNSGTTLETKKSSYMCHSELNAILNYRGNLGDFEGASIYITMEPCHECMKAIIQVGIKEVIYKDTYHHRDIADFARLLAKKCGIIYKQYKEEAC